MTGLDYQNLETGGVDWVVGSWKVVLVSARGTSERWGGRCGVGEVQRGGGGVGHVGGGGSKKQELQRPNAAQKGGAGAIKKTTGCNSGCDL